MKQLFKSVDGKSVNMHGDGDATECYVLNTADASDRHLVGRLQEGSKSGYKAQAGDLIVTDCDNGRFVSSGRGDSLLFQRTCREDYLQQLYDECQAAAAQRATEASEPPERDPNAAWCCKEINGKWYWFNDQGYPSIPYDNESHAQQGIDDYDATYYDY